MRQSSRAFWIEVGLFSLVSLLAYRFGLLRASGMRPGLLLVFTLPIQLCWVRRGQKAGLLSSLGVLAGVAIWDLVDYVRFAEVVANPGTVFLDLVPVLGYLAGLYLLNSVEMSIRVSGQRRSLNVGERMLAAIGVLVLVHVPAGIAAYSSAGFELVKDELAVMVSAAFPMFEISEAQVLEMLDLAVSRTLRGLVVGLFVILVGNWWLGTRVALGTRIASGAENAVAERLRLLSVKGFRLPGWMVWAVVASLGAIVLSLVVPLGWLSYVVWNAALIVFLFYAFQGMGVARHLLDRRGGRQRPARTAIAGLVLGLVVPGMDILLVLGLALALVVYAGLGLSEVWVNYHRFERSGEEK
jgi:hypothetical protein